MAVMAVVKARKYENQYVPWGVAVPRYSITGKCQAPHKTPSKMPEFNALCWRFTFGNAYPIQPISSKSPAGTPNKIPVKKRPGAKTGEMKDFKQSSTARTKLGGS